MHYILFDDTCRDRLLPFTHTRPVADVRCGILTMRVRWELYIKEQTTTLTEAYLQQVYPLHTGADNMYINGAVFATNSLMTAIQGLQPGHKLTHGNVVIAARSAEDILDIKEFHNQINTLPTQHFDGDIYSLKNVWDIFALNDRALRDDYQLLTKGRKSAPIPEGVTVTGKEHIFIEDTARIYAGCIINATTGPVYIGPDAEVL